MPHSLSIIIPAYNEGDGIAPTLERLKATALKEQWDLEMIVIDDGSSDDTGSKARAAGATVLRNPVNSGYGLSLRRGIAAARNERVAITDADGTYPVESLPSLLAMMDDGLDMAVGARQGMEYRKGVWKHPARLAFRWIAEFVAGRRIPDINSGLRIMRRSVLLPYLPMTCMGFSFTTSITLILMLNGHFVAYQSIAYEKRIGHSKVRHVRDTLRTAQIITSIIAAHNPIKLAILINAFTISVSIACFVLTALLARVGGYALFFSSGFWLMGVVVFASLPIVFMLGCLGELLRVYHVSKS